MSRNIEIKAKIEDYQQTKKIFARITQNKPVKLNQRDIFYNLKSYRLKMRTINNDSHEWIFYSRPNSADMKLSKYKRFNIKHPKLVDKILSVSLGRTGEVKKVRQLFLKDNIRFHLDRVENLGDFIELEYVIPEKESIQTAKKNVKLITEQLNIKKKDYIDVAYMDLINRKNKKHHSEWC